VFQSPLSLFGHPSLPRSEFSSILFVRHPPGHIDFKEVESFFPTLYLIEAFEMRRFGQLANKDALYLFYGLREHALKKMAAG